MNHRTKLLWILLTLLLAVPILADELVLQNNIPTKSEISVPQTVTANKPLLDQLTRMDLSKNFKLSGYKTIEWRKSGNSGSSPADAKTDEMRSETLKLNMIGSWENVTANIDINQSSQLENSETKQRIVIEHPNFSLIFGEFQSDFATANLLEYQEQIDGTKCQLFLGDHQGSLILSKLKGVRQKNILKGNNSQGPYTVSAPPIVSNSETVWIQDKQLQKDTDYRIDYGSGKITFIKAMIPQDQEITVIYESNNALLSNQVTGYSYQFSGIPSANTRAYYIQKRSSDTAQTTAETDIFLITQDYKKDAFYLNSELGLSKYTANVVSANLYEQGPAGYLKLGYKTQTLNSHVYALKITPGYVPLNSYKIHPGDWTWGLYSSWTDDPHSAVIQYDALDITENDTPIKEKDLLLSGKSMTWGIPYSVTYKQKEYTQWPDDITKGDKYVRHTIDTSGQLDPGFGKLIGNGGLEIDYYKIQPEKSFQRKTLQAGYSIAPGAGINFAVDTSLIQKQMLNTLSEENEQHLKLSSQLSTDQWYSLSGFYEWIFYNTQPNVSIYDIQSKLSPFKGLDLELSINDERLKEELNQILVDIEKIDANLKIKVEPIKNLKLDLGYKPKFKQIKPIDLKVTNKELYSFNMAYPLTKWAQTSYVFKRQLDNALQVKYYPIGLFQDNISKADTHILRLKVGLLYDINCNLQYEKDINQLETLSVTYNPTYKLDLKEKDIKKIEFTKQWNTLIWGGSYETSLLTQKEPTQNYSLEDKYSMLCKWNFAQDCSISPKVSFLNTKTDTEQFSSISPEVALIYTWGIVQITFQYTLLQSFKQTLSEKSNKYTLGAKSELNKNIVLDGECAYETHQNPNYVTYTGSAKVSIFF